MEAPERLTEARFKRLMRDIAALDPFPNRLDGPRSAAGTLLKQMRERAGLSVADVGPLYAAAYRRLFPEYGDSSVSPNTIRNWEKGKGDPQHGLRSFFALFAVYIAAAPQAQAISHEHVENALYLYGFRRLYLEEIKALFPERTSSPAAAARDVTELGTMRRYAAGASADMYYDEMSDEERPVREVGWIVADSDGPVFQEQAIDVLETATRQVARSGADPDAFIEAVSGVVKTTKEPSEKNAMDAILKIADRLSRTSPR